MTITKQNMLKKKRGLQPGEMIPLSFDEAFKIMYANPKYMEILTLLISKILKVEYQLIEGKVELAPTTIPNRTIGEKKCERDIVVSLKTSPKYKIILEVNIRKEFYQSIMDRNLYYAFQVAGGGLKEGDNYQDIGITFLVNFNDFYVDNRSKKALDFYLLRNEEGHILSDREKVLNINVEACYNLWYNKSYIGKFEPYEEDLILLCAAMHTNLQQEFEECLETVRARPEIIELMERNVEEMSQDEELWGRWYNKEQEEAILLESMRREDIERGRSEGYNQGKSEGYDQGKSEGYDQGKSEGYDQGKSEGYDQGKSEGIDEGRKQIIQKLLQNKMSPQEISETIEINIEEIQKYC